MNEFLQRLKQRRLVQWALAYVAAALALLQGIDIVAQRFRWPDSIERILIIASRIGFFVARVLAAALRGDPAFKKLCEAKPR